VEARFRPGGYEVAMSHRLLVALLALVLALGAAACGGDDGAGGGGDGNGGDGGASAADVPGGAVATVGDEEITEEQLDTRVTALRRSQPKGAKPSREQLEQQALAALLQAAWLEQEAKERDVRVSNAAIERRWTRAAEAQFPNERALRRFLGGQTKRDLLYQLRLQALTERIHQQIREEAGEGNGDKAVEEFQREFQKRWQDRTGCREGYVVSGCGNAKG
jgi:SurA N-terminal domain